MMMKENNQNHQKEIYWNLSAIKKSLVNFNKLH